MAAVDYFLKLDGIDGESTDDRHKNEIDVESFSWGLSNATSATGGGAVAGKAVFQDFHFAAPISKASPKLFLVCATGEHIKEANLTCRKAGGGAGEQQEFYIVKLTDVRITSYQQGGAGGDDTVPTDQFSLNFAKIEVEYFQQKADGTLDAPVKAGYDLKANKKV